MDQMFYFLQTLEYLGESTLQLDITSFFTRSYLTMVKQDTTNYD